MTLFNVTVLFLYAPPPSPPSDCRVIMADVKTTLGEFYGGFGIGEGLSLLICFCLSVCLIALAPPRTERLRFNDAVYVSESGDWRLGEEG